jgi:thioredoxin-like negative regulator of GroEL
MAVKKRFSSLQDLINDSSVPVLVCFYGSWCSASQTYAPILEKVKHQLGSRMQVIKINADQYPQLVSQHQIQVLPTSLLFMEHELACRIKGVMRTC